MATILLIDDNTYMLDVMRRLLQPKGHRILQASNGACALEIVTRNWPDLIVSDIVLPDVDGTDLVCRIRQMPGGEKLPVVAISALTTRLHDEAAAAARFDACLDKPDTEHLVEMVETLLALCQTPDSGGPSTSGAALQLPAEEELVEDVQDQIERLRRQNEELSSRHAALADNFRVMIGLVDAFRTDRDSGALIDNGLRGCIDAMHASRGLLYLDDRQGGLQLRGQQGYEKQSALLGSFFGHLDELQGALRNNRMVRFDEAAITVDARSVALALPLSLPRPIGVLVLVLKVEDLDESRMLALRAIAGQLGQSLAMTHALAALRESEMQLLHTQKMDAVGKLAGGVAHDFNNLVTAINGYATLLTRRLAPSDPNREFAQEIQDAASRATSLTRQLLAFSRRQTVAFEALDPNQVVSGIERMLRRLIGEDIHLVTDLDPQVSKVWADTGQIEQLILNLAVNSRDAMPRGGRLVIRTADVVLEPSFVRCHGGGQDTQFVRLTVEDNGCGMDVGTMSHIFEPFFTTKGQTEGTGLGLSTVYGIVKQCDGFIDVSSKVGEGTTFKVFLPRTGPTASAASQPAPCSEFPGGCETILLVEDEQSVRHCTASILRDRGYQLLEARDGLEALEVCKSHGGPIDLLLTDVVMPKMNGCALVEQFNRVQPQAKVLYASGYTDDAIIRNGIARERAPFLEKPFRADTLTRKVREVLDADRALAISA